MLGTRSGDSWLVKDKVALFATTALLIALH